MKTYICTVSYRFRGGRHNGATVGCAKRQLRQRQVQRNNQPDIVRGNHRQGPQPSFLCSYERGRTPWQWTPAPGIIYGSALYICTYINRIIRTGCGCRVCESFRRKLSPKKKCAWHINTKTSVGTSLSSGGLVFYNLSTTTAATLPGTIPARDTTSEFPMVDGR